MAGQNDDLGIVFAQDTEPWKDYFKKALGEKDSELSLHISSVCIDSLQNSLFRNQICSCTSLLILISPDFVEWLQQSSAADWLFCKPTATSMLFLSVEDDEYLQNNIPKYSKVSKMYMPQNNEEITGELLKKICTEVIEKFESASREKSKKKAPKPAAKPKKELSRVVSDPQQAERVEICMGKRMETCAETCEQQVATESVPEDDHYVGFRLVNPSKIHPMMDSVVLIMKSSRNRNEKYSREGILITLSSETHSFRLDFDKCSNYTFVASLPKDCPPGVYQISFHFNNVLRASSPIEVISPSELFRETLCQSVSPIQLFADILNIETTKRDGIDSALCDMLDSTFPDESIKFSSMFTQYFQKEGLECESSEKELPTMLHFAAKFGLEKFCLKLMQCPGADLAFSIDNKNGDYPSNIAEKAGFPELAQYLEDEMEMLSLQKCAEDYMSMTFKTAPVAKDTYSVAPPSCAPLSPGVGYVTSDLHYANRTGNTMYYNAKPTSDYDVPTRHVGYGDVYDSIGPDYMTMAGEPPIPGRSQENTEDDVQAVYLECDLPLQSPDTSRKQPGRCSSFKEVSRYVEEPRRSPNNTLPAGFKPDFSVGGIMEPGPAVPAESGSRTQDNLLDINRGVASGEYTLEEAESLFKALINRNTSYSLKERKKRLDDLRSQYGNVIESVNKGSQSKGIFGFFKRKKRKPTIVIEPKIEHLRGVPDQSEEIVEEPDDLPQINKYRSSSTSLSSNGSRGSTLSSSSFGHDSGTVSGNDLEQEYSTAASTRIMAPIDEGGNLSPHPTRRRMSERKVSSTARYSRSEALLKDQDTAPAPKLPPRVNPGRPLTNTPSREKSLAPTPAKRLVHKVSAEDLNKSSMFKQKAGEKKGTSSEESCPEEPPPPPPPRSARPSR